jgi:hypothetical protein
VTFNSKNRRGKSKKIIRVFSNDPENPIFTVTIMANVKQPQDIVDSVEKQ